MLRTLRIAAILALAAGLVATVAPVAGALDPDAPCVSVSGGSACGQAQAHPCAIATAEGQATVAVDWELRMWTYSSLYGWRTASDTMQDSTTFVGYVSDWCATDTCTWAALYADGVLVDAPPGVC